MTSDSALEELLSIEGIMVAGRPGQIRLLIDQAVVDLEENDVLSATELPVPAEMAAKLAQPVRLELRRGARLLDVGAAEAYDDVAWERGELFALRTRREEPSWRMSDSYLELERRFFAKYGIAVAGEVDGKEEEQP
jgi:hypothetical protein